MDFANAEPSATSKPMLTGSTGLIRAALDAMMRLDGLAKGTRFRPNEVKRIARSSANEAMYIPSDSRSSAIVRTMNEVGYMNWSHTSALLNSAS